MDKHPLGDIVVLIPGITGSVLTRDGEDVWALSGGAALNAVLSLGRSITSLGLVDDRPDVDVCRWKWRTERKAAGDGHPPGHVTNDGWPAGHPSSVRAGC